MPAATIDAMGATNVPPSSVARHCARQLGLASNAFDGGLEPGFFQGRINQEVGITLKSGATIYGIVDSTQSTGDSWRLILRMGIKGDRFKVIRFPEIVSVDLYPQNTSSVSSQRLSLVETSESLPTNSEDRYHRNGSIISANAEHIRREVMPRLVHTSAFDALETLYIYTLRGFYFELPAHLKRSDDPSFELNNQRYYRSVPLRTKNRLLVSYGNHLPLNGDDLGEVLDVFTNQLDRFIARIARDLRAGVRPSPFQMRRILSLAEWARRMVVFMQPGADGNTRVGREYFMWVVGRIRHLSGAAIPQIAPVTADEGSDGGLKDQMFAWYAGEVNFFARQQQRHWLYLSWEEEPEQTILARHPSAVIVLPADLFSPSFLEFFGEDMHTQKLFLLNYLRDLEPNTTVVDRNIAATVDAIMATLP
jgi:hypothetical protein